LILEPDVKPYKKIKEYLDHISSEVLEAAIESENPQSVTISGKLQKPEGFASEAADIIILTLAMCLHNDVDIEWALDLKMKYLKRRENERLSNLKDS